MLYIVLKPISPAEGPIIEPAVATADNPTPEPVLLDATFFRVRPTKSAPPIFSA